MLKVCEPDQDTFTLKLKKDLERALCTLRSVNSLEARRTYNAIINDHVDLRHNADNITKMYATTAHDLEEIQYLIDNKFY